MLYRITEIKIETIIKNNGREEYLIWAVDNHGRDWHVESSGLYGECTKLRLGKTERYRRVENKELGIVYIRKYIDKQNEEFKRLEASQIKSSFIENIPIK